MLLFFIISISLSIYLFNFNNNKLNIENFSNYFYLNNNNNNNIKNMKLYGNIDRIIKDLLYNHNINFFDSKYIDPNIVDKYSYYNYAGPESAIYVCNKFNLSSNTNLLDFGGGIGGPSRKIAYVSNTSITSIELQKDISNLFKELNKKTNLDSLIDVINNDIFNISLKKNSFDYAVSWLTILHIPIDKRYELFTKIFSLLKPNSKMYIEDFYWISENGNFDQQQINSLKNNVSIPNGILPTKNEYLNVLYELNCVVEFVDSTHEWIEFTKNRLDVFHSNKDRHIKVYNETTYNNLDLFYSSIVDLFNSSKLGGAKIIISIP